MPSNTQSQTNMTEYAWEFLNNALWDTVLTTLYLDHLALAEQGSTVTTAQTTSVDTINNTMLMEETTQVDIADISSTTILTLVIAGCVGGLLFVGVVVTSFLVLCVSNVYPVFWSFDAGIRWYTRRTSLS